MKHGPSIESLLKAINQDKAFTPYQTSLYTAMLTCWQEQACPVSFNITRNRLMALSGIKSFATYHQCLRVLVNHRYIVYIPSHNNRVGSRITLLTQP